MAGSLYFDGVGDEVVMSLGGGTVTTAFTFATVICPFVLSTSPVWLEDSPGGLQIGRDTGGEWFMWGGASQLSLGTIATRPSLGTWTVQIAGRNAGSSQTVRLSRLTPSDQVIVHENAVQLMHDLTAVTSWRIGRYGGGGFDFNGNIAAVYIWKRNLSDGERATLLNHDAAVALSPDEWFRLDGSAPFSGGVSSTQSSITGTVHSTSEPVNWWSNVRPLSYDPFPKLVPATPGA